MALFGSEDPGLVAPVEGNGGGDSWNCRICWAIRRRDTDRHGRPGCDRPGQPGPGQQLPSADHAPPTVPRTTAPPAVTRGLVVPHEVVPEVP